MIWPRSFIIPRLKRSGRWSASRVSTLRCNRAGSPVHGRPLVNLSLALNYHFAELGPRAYRLTNIALHAISAIVLSAVIRRTLRQPFFQERFAAVAEPLAFAASLAWALHPLATECVVYVTQRTEVLMALCYFSTIYMALRYWEAESARGRAGWLTLAMLCCQLGMLSKETSRRSRR